MKKTNLKRFLLLFCMLACVFSMTACGNAQIDTNTAKESIKDNEVAYVENYLKDWAKDMIFTLTAIRVKQEQMLLLQMQKQE